jgi:16S rRNA (uracil1498-N3)-methyltransferase
MRLHRFYIPEIIGSNTELIFDLPDVVHQIRKVFRLKKGDLLIIFDGSGADYTCGIEDFRDETIVLGVSAVGKSRFMPQREVYLCAALVKKDTFEWIVEKATELGVSNIIPVVAERSEKKNINEDRLKKITIEASEQSGRGSVPNIGQVVSLREAICVIPFLPAQTGKKGIQTDKAPNGSEKMDAIAFHTDGEPLGRFDLREIESPLALFIGPEGGWSPDEIALFHEHNIPVRSIGTQVLRAETAVVATLSLVMLGRE